MVGVRINHFLTSCAFRLTTIREWGSVQSVSEWTMQGNILRSYMCNAIGNPPPKHVFRYHADEISMPKNVAIV
jgi:hypothetical protein